MQGTRLFWLSLLQWLASDDISCELHVWLLDDSLGAMHLYASGSQMFQKVMCCACGSSLIALFQVKSLLHLVSHDKMPC